MRRSLKSGAAPGPNSLLTSSKPFPKRWTRQALGGYALPNLRLLPSLKSPVKSGRARTATRSTSLRDTSSRSTTITSHMKISKGCLHIFDKEPLSRIPLGHTIFSGHVSVYGYRYLVLLGTTNSKQFHVVLRRTLESNSRRAKATSRASTCSSRRSSRSKSSKAGKTSTARGSTSTKS